MANKRAGEDERVLAACPAEIALTLTRFEVDLRTGTLSHLRITAAPSNTQ
jgi:hypothetical protein